MKRLIRLLLLGAAIGHVNSVTEDTFGSGANTFDIELVTIGNPGNLAYRIIANPDFAGSVPYTNRIGMHEISREMVAKAVNAGGLGITLAQQRHKEVTVGEVGSHCFGVPRR